MGQRHNSIAVKLSTVPTEPGVYLMRNSKNEIIYVGKAKNLKVRVSSYFQQRDHTPKTVKLVEQITDFDFLLVKTELEALLLERKLIKTHQPQYNVLLRDDKDYPFVRVDWNEPWPRLEKVRRRKDDGAVYVGPFTSGLALHTLLNSAFRIFPMIRCTRHEFSQAKRPCNYYHIHMCSAPCSLPVAREDYIAMLKDALAILEGKNRAVMQDLKMRMALAAEHEAFEKAAQLRDQIFAMEKIAEKQGIILKNTEDVDIIAWAADDSDVSLHILPVRDYSVAGGESHVFPLPLGTREDILESFLLQYYENRLPSKNILLPFELPNSNVLLELLSASHQMPIKFIPAKGRESQSLVEMAQKNADHHLAEESKRRRVSFVGLEMVRDLVQMNALPRRIECIDISNLQGSHIVASNVCFIDGKPAKDLYRLYNVMTVTDTPNDFASIEEIVRRRLRRAIEEDDAPDLLVIDGGQGQLNAALKAAHDYPDVEVTIVGLAKSRVDRHDPDMSQAPMRSHERIFIAGQEHPRILKMGTPAYRILTQIRDEAHRFAINFHRQKRSKAMVTSVLERIPGVGPKMRTQLMTHFGSIERIEKATIQELMQLKGMRESVAMNIKLAFQKQESEATQEP